MDVGEVCQQVWRCGGTAAASELSVDRRAMRRALDSGAVVRLSRGVYGLSTQRPPLLAAARLHGTASHLSAAQLWMLEVVHAPAQPHVTVRRNRRVAAPGAGVHWADLPPEDVDGLVTTPLRTVVDCARTLPFREALAVADSALRRGLVTRRELQERADLAAGPGARAVRRVAEHASAEAANPFESALRGTALDAGLTGLAPQVELRVGGRAVRPDLVDRALRLVCEADSFAWHGDRASLAEDCRRYDDLVAAGWTVLRFAWEQVMFDEAWVAGVLRATAARLGVPTSGRTAPPARPRAGRAPVSTPVGTPVLPAPRYQNRTVAKVPTWVKPTAS